MPSLVIIPMPSVDGGLLSALRDPVFTIFGLNASVAGPPGHDPAQAFDPARHQYNSTALLASLLRYPLNDGDKILGITPLDLFVPVLTYVFGEAQLDGKAAVVSTFRLDDRIYGLPAAPDLLRDRLIKEVLHELGHTFGLLHCREFECVMHSSTAVEEIDLKPSSLCTQCAGMIRRV